MTQVIIKEFIYKNEKALIYCGLHHAFTKYKYPVTESGNFSHFFDHRVGNQIHQQIKNRTITICLHSPWESLNGSYYPADGIIDTLMKVLPEQYRRIGFDTQSTPLGDLQDNHSIYRYGNENFTLQDFCDGYVYQKPFSEYEGVNTIPDFITSENINAARSRFNNYSFKFIFDHFGTVFWNYAISMDANLAARFSKFR